MIKVLLFQNSQDNNYGDSLYTAEAEYRPVVGDIYLVSWIVGEPYGLEVEAIVCVSATVIHAYCKPIKSDKTHGPYFGVRGNKGSLIAHTEDQMNDFPELYQDDQ